MAVGGGVTKTASLSLTVVVPSFTLTLSASKATVSAAIPAKITLTTTAVNGFKSALALSVSGLPKGVSASFLPTSIAAPGSGASKLTLTETTGATSGTYYPTVTAAGGGVTKTQKLTLTVVAPGFAMTLSGTSVSLKPGGTIPITVTTGAFNGFKSGIALHVSGMPTGVSATYWPAAIAAPGNGKSTPTLKMAPWAIAKAGTYTVTMTGTGGGVTQTRKLTLTII